MHTASETVLLSNVRKTSARPGKRGVLDLAASHQGTQFVFLITLNAKVVKKEIWNISADILTSHLLTESNSHIAGEKYFC